MEIFLEILLSLINKFQISNHTIANPLPTKNYLLSFLRIPKIFVPVIDLYTIPN